MLEKPSDIWPNDDPEDRAWHLFKLIRSQAQKDYDLNLNAWIGFPDYDSVRFQFEGQVFGLSTATVTWAYSLESLGLLVVGPRALINMDIMPRMAMLAEQEIMAARQMAANVAVYIVEHEEGEPDEPTC